MSRVTKIACWSLPWFPILFVGALIVDAYERGHPWQLTTHDWMRMTSPDGPLPPSVTFEIVAVALAVALLFFVIGLVLLGASCVARVLRRKTRSV
jgi:hypothetical protein